jgi:DNA primase
MPSWIDFKELRSKLKFEDVLTHYGVEVKRRGEQHLGSCPLPNHQGSRKAPSFSANLERGIFHCFGCQAKGNILDFAVLMSGEPVEDGRTLKKVALELQATFCSGDSKRPAKKPVGSEEPAAKQLELEVSVNAPLNFELKGLDRSHPYLSEQGLAAETVAHFGLGYCARGSLAGRIAIPLHDQDGSLIGYAGRVVDDAAITDENSCYQFPSKRERNGVALEFRKDLFLYNGYRFKTPVTDLVVVAGFPSVWWLHQNGFRRVVATMGTDCSDEQARLIVSLTRPEGMVRVMPDGDEAGEKLAYSLFEKIAPLRFIRWAKLERGERPTDLSVEELKECLTA